MFVFLFSAFEIWFKQILEDLEGVITTFQIPVSISQFKREFTNSTTVFKAVYSHIIRTGYQTINLVKNYIISYVQF